MLAFVILMLAALPALADGPSPAPPATVGDSVVAPLRATQAPPALTPSSLHTSARPIDPSTAARRAKQSNGGGRVLSVSPEADGYHVRILKHGEVKIVVVPDS